MKPDYTDEVRELLLFLVTVGLVVFAALSVRAEAPKCDPHCSPDDPICIPCDLELAGQVCTTVCRWSHLYGRPVCVTQCQESCA